MTFNNLDTIEEVKRQAQFSYLVNSIPEAKDFWSDTGKKTWSIYQRAISNIKLSQAELDDSDKAKLKKAIEYLQIKKKKKDPFDDTVSEVTEATEYLNAYNKYLNDYETALMEYNTLMITATAEGADPIAVKNYNLNGPAYRRRLTNAFAAWAGEGNKDNVEKARAIISMVNGRGNEQIYNDLKATFDINKRESPNLGLYYPTYYYPDNALKGNSWTKISFKINEASSFSSSDKTSWGGGASRSWLFGLFSVGASASYSSSYEHSEADTSGLDVSYEVLQLPLLRPWLDTSIFETRNWKWADNSKDLISNGLTLPEGLMPLIPTSVLIARNLRIKIDTTSEKNKSFLKKASGSASCGFSFFSLKGNYSSESSEQTHNFKATDNEITCEGMQIIGFICKKLPKSPNPDPSLIW